MGVYGYTAVIPEGVESWEGYVKMQHGTQYRILLRNNNDSRCNAQITIDGLDVGTWRILPNKTVMIERGVDDDGLFTFFKTDSKEAIAVGLNSTNRNQLGLIVVTFIPEMESTRNSPVEKEVTRGKGVSAGGTGLTGRSEQEFGIAENMITDRSKAVMISLRLVASNRTDEPRPLRGNPVPPPPN